MRFVQFFPQFILPSAPIQIYLTSGVTKIKDVVYIMQKTDVKCDAEFDFVPTSLVLMPWHHVTMNDCRAQVRGTCI